MFSWVYETTSRFRFPKTFVIFTAKTQNANGLNSKQRAAAHCANGRVSLDCTAWPEDRHAIDIMSVVRLY
jgi:hypothetical protein